MIRLSQYGDDLPEPAKSRYAKKVLLCGGTDPLLFGENETSREADNYPNVDVTDISDYLVHGTSFVSRAQFKAYKSLEAHNFLTSGWVEEPRLKFVNDDNVVVITKVCVYLGGT